MAMKVGWVSHVVEGIGKSLGEAWKGGVARVE